METESLADDATTPRGGTSHLLSTAAAGWGKRASATLLIDGSPRLGKHFPSRRWRSPKRP